MKPVKYWAFIILSGIIFYSCDPCGNLDCVSDNYYGQFRIVSATTGQDLVFGQGKIFDKNQIKFFSVTNADTTFLDYQIIKFPGTGYDSILYVSFVAKNNIAFMKLSNGDIDTLAITYKTYDLKCCGTITQITNFRFNNLVDIPGDMGTQEIRK